MNTVKDALTKAGATVEIIAPRQGTLISKGKSKISVDKGFLTAASVFYDAVYVPGGAKSIAALEAVPDAVHFLNEAFKHCKAIAADEEARPLLEATYFSKKLNDEGVITNSKPASLAKQFITAIAQHRFWNREKERKVPA